MTVGGRRPVAMGEAVRWPLCQPHDVVSSVVSNGSTLVVDDILPLLAEESP